MVLATVDKVFLSKGDTLRAQHGFTRVLGWPYLESYPELFSYWFGKRGEAPSVDFPHRPAEVRRAAKVADRVVAP